MDRLLGLLKDHEVGTWCKQAAWIILGINLFHLILEFYTLVVQVNGPSPITLGTWATIINALLSVVEATLFYFFILYAAGVLVNHLTGSTEEEDEEDEEDEEEETAGQVQG
jgi:hypothetical protein